MITDALLRLSGTSANPPVAGPVTTLTAANTSTTVYYIDLQQSTNVSGGTQTVQNRDLGEGYPIQCVVTIVTAASAGTTLTFNVIVADDAVGTTNPIVIGTTGAIALASLTAGAQFAIAINPQFNTLGKRYLMGQYVTGPTTNLVGATHFMDIVLDSADSKKFYAGGFVVS